MHRQLVVLRVERDFVLFGVVDNLDARSIFGVIEGNDVTGARFDDAFVHLATGDHVGGLAWRRGFAIPQPAQHEREVDIAVLESHQYFVIYFRQELHPAVLAATWDHDARPIAAVLVGQPGEFDLHPTQVLVVVVVGDDANDQSSPRRRQPVPIRSEHGQQRVRLESGHREPSDVANGCAPDVRRAGDEVFA